MWVRTLYALARARACRGVSIGHKESCFDERSERPPLLRGAAAAQMQASTTSPPRFRTYPLPTSTQHMRVSNKATALRELQKSQLMHVDKLRKMKPGIDMTSPKQYPHVQYNAKRMQVGPPRPLLGARGRSHALRMIAPERCSRPKSIHRVAPRARWRRSGIWPSSGRTRSFWARCTRL